MTAAEEYEGLLRRLHALDKAGLGESAEAEEVRDLSDVYWYEMTAEEARGPQ